MEKLKLVGYWEDEESSRDYPHPRSFVCPGWLSREEKAKVVSYLRSAQICRGSFGFSYCRFEDGPGGKIMGSNELSDGTYIWPEGLWVYVEMFNVAIPDDFLEHIKGRNYQIPNGEIDFPVPVEINYDYWLAEAEKFERKHRLE